MYRMIPLRMLRRTTGVKFDEMVPSDIPKIHGIDRVIHGPNSVSPGPVEDSPVPVKRPWYMHPGQDDNLLVLQLSTAHDVRRRKLRSHSQECKVTVLHILAYGLEFIVKILHRRRLIRPRKVLCDKFRPLLKCNPHSAHRRPSILLVPLHLVLVVSHNVTYPSCYTKKN